MCEQLDALLAAPGGGALGRQAQLEGGRREVAAAAEHDDPHRRRLARRRQLPQRDEERRLARARRARRAKHLTAQDGAPQQQVRPGCVAQHEPRAPLDRRSSSSALLALLRLAVAV